MDFSKGTLEKQNLHTQEMFINIPLYLQFNTANQSELPLGRKHIILNL